MNIALPIDAALRDRNLLGAALGDNKSWDTWQVVLRAMSGLPLDEKQREVFSAVSGGRAPPTERVKELWAVVGRRGGKSRTAAAIAVHTAMMQQHKLAPGENGYVLVLSQTVLQAKVVFDYCFGFIEASPVLRGEMIDATRSEIRLQNNVVIATHPASYRSVRGRTLLCVIFDESASWRDETSANPDIEVFRAVKPALIASGGQLIGIGSPYRRMGLLFNRHKDYFGVDDPNVLVVQAGSRAFNPTLNEADIAAALVDDPEGARAEWEGVFRDDIAAFLSDADIDACIDHDRPLELPPRPGITYRAFVDASGGRHDSFTICIAHLDRTTGNTIIDAVRGRTPPFDPADVVREHNELLKQYALREITGDAYGAEWVAQAYRAVGVKLTHSELPKSRLYLEGLPMFSRHSVALPDHPRLLRELRLLERKTHSGGRDSVDHGRNGSDDHANVVFGAMHVASKRKPKVLVGTYAMAGGPTGCEIDPRTLLPIGPERSRVRCVRVDEASVPAVRGPY